MSDPEKIGGAVSRMDDAEAVLKKFNYDKTKLVPILQEVQEKYKWLSKELLSYISCAMGLPPSRVFGVATFYAGFSLKPKGKHIIKLCDGTACHVKGSTNILEALRGKLKMSPGADTTDDMNFTIETVSCLGACGLAPVMIVDEDVHGQLKPEMVAGIIDEVLNKENTEVA